MPIPPLAPAPSVLPPYLGLTPAVRESRSPYKVSFEEVVRCFGTSERRIKLLQGLLGYRRELRRLQIRAAFQWLAGSFVENPGREPRDVDVVTFYRLTADELSALHRDAERWQPFRELFQYSKSRFHCDAHLVNMVEPEKIVTATHYWYGLFSHQRGSLAWKGMLEVEMASVDDDRACEEILSSMVIP
jgi:hypothetical protein